MTPHALKTLAWVKRRRIEELDREVAAQRETVRRCAAAVDDAEAAIAAGEADGQRCVVSIEGQLARPGGFRGGERTTLQVLLDSARAATKKARLAIVGVRKQLDHAQAQLDALLRRQRRAQSQIEQLDERRVVLERTADQAVADAQDEESEEAAVARAGGRRGARENAAARGPR